MVIERERDWEPLAHDLVHGVQAPKALVAQWIGHGPLPHARVSAPCGQAMPPLVGCTVWRERLCEPLPHDLVHDVHRLQVPVKQFTGHPCELHARVSV